MSVRSKTKKRPPKERACPGKPIISCFLLLVGGVFGVEALFDKKADRFGATGDVLLLSAPIINEFQKILGNTHLKGSVFVVCCCSHMWNMGHVLT